MAKAGAKKTSREKIETSRIRTVIKVMVSDDTTVDEAKALREELEEFYEEQYDKGDAGTVYEALNDFFKQARISGDYDIETPEFSIYSANGQQLA